MARPVANRWSLALRSAVASMLLLAPPARGAQAQDSGLDLRHAGGAANVALLQGPGLADSVEELYLEVYLNSVQIHRVLQISVARDGRLLAWAENLRDCGLRVDAAQIGQYLALDSLADVSHRYDAPNQRLYLDADPARLNVRAQRYGYRDGKVWPASVSPGALLNYDLYASAGEQQALAAGTALRLFGLHGVIESTGLSRFARQQDSEPYVRLDTAWTISLQDELQRLIVGDHLSGSLPWTRATRMGGVQLRRDFALQPGLLTYPVPQFFGEAALPSRIELYVNGVRQYEGSTPPGPFQLSTPPSVSGAGLAQVVLTDALGRAQTIDFSFYNANRLLRAGYSDYALGLGAVRRDYGIDSFRYREQPAVNASYARGVSDWLTLESHVEGDGDVWMGGLGQVVRLGRYGSARSAYAHSRSRDQAQGDGGPHSGSGGQLALGYNYTARGYTADYSLQRAGRGFRDLAAAEGRVPSLRSEQALLGSALGPYANASISYVRLDSADDERFRSLGFNASTVLRHSLSLFLSLTRDLDGERDLGAFVGVSASFGPRLNAGAGYSENGNARAVDAYVASPVPADGGSGWQLRARRADSADTLQADVGGRGDYGSWSAGLQTLDDQLNGFVAASGGIVMMDAALFPSRQVDQGFALVTTNGVADVPVLFENRPIGKTDARGHYLLTGLNAFQPNRVSIDTLHLPAQIQAAQEIVNVVPADRAGVRVEFGLRESRAALLILHDAQDRPIDVGSRVLRDGQPLGLVGFDGQSYLENLGLHNRISIAGADQDECTVSFDLPSGASGIPVIGPLRCRP
ncbi:MAG TPA: fimbria/pilus outer membrane usher protein [Fontimonas sp.]